MLLRVARRAAATPGIASVAIATSTEDRDTPVVGLAREHDLEVFTGSEADVLDRYYRAALAFSADAVVRITGDCPLLDPLVSGRVVARFLEGGLEYATNCHPPTFPDGLDTEIVAVDALERAWRHATIASDREHVTPYIWKRPGEFRQANVASAVNLSASRWTVDDERDLRFVREVYARLLPIRGEMFGMEDVLSLLDRQPELRAINAGTTRNEGYREVQS
jgi:spore coat polysaccharide biosynthesis protein SpsF (cytidylyltransferase family)